MDSFVTTEHLIIHVFDEIIIRQVIGVLDWELSTIGDPLCDVANISMMYYLPSPKKGLGGIAGIAGM